jgi:hypothetical protein
VPPQNTSEKRLSGDALLIIGVSVCAVVIVGAVVSLRFLQKAPPPPPPAPPPPPEASVGRVLRFSEPYYKAVLEEDAKKLHVAAVAPSEFAQPMPFADELSAPRKLKVQKDAVETAHLRLATSIIKEWASTNTGQRFRYDHIVLSITNKSKRPIAYLVETSIDHPERCGSKGAIAHNAIALRPGETIQRTECLWHAGAQLSVNKVQTVELPFELSYYFVSRLIPAQFGLDERTAAGHEIPAGGKQCSFVPWRDIQASQAQAGTGWADVIDFYARHDCDEYSYWRGYRRWTSPGALPARAPDGSAVDRATSSK